jgi:hypothetical protein
MTIRDLLLNSVSGALGCVLPCVALAGDVTFYKDVLPVLEQRCDQCHRPGESTPMSLLTYKEARPWAAAIKEAVLSKKMPPWFADPAHSRFANDRTLPNDERDVLVAWANGGATEGNPKDAPKLLAFTDGWTIGKPDLVIEMPMEYMVQAVGKVDYTYVVIPTGFTEDKWVEAVEVRPSNRSVFHHVVLLSRSPGSSYMSEALPGEPFVPAEKEKRHQPDTGEGQFALFTGNVEIVSVYVPGGVAYRTRQGQARLIKARSDLVFQMHFTANGKVQADHSKVGFVFARQAPKERVVNTFVQNPNIHIPPGESNYREVAKVKLYEDVKVQSLFPHMHVRGKALQYRAIYPTGESQVLRSVPRYDFNWQLTYDLADPLVLPKGTELEVTAWYDNSANNPFNPDPKADVWWGPQTWDEMLAGFVDFAIPSSMSPQDLAIPAPQRVANK